jgi:hypothetical protein
VGTVSGIIGDTLYLAPTRVGAPTRAVPLSAVTALELSQGRTNHAKLGAGIGLAVGLIAGIAIGESQVEPNVCDFEEEGFGCLAPESPEGLDDAGAIILASSLGGAVLGYIVGTALGSERWAPLSDSDAGLSLGTTGGGIGIKVSSRF